MPTKEEMRSLAEEIVRSYEERIKVIPELKQAEAERKRTATQEIAQRKSDVSTMLKEFAKGDTERKSEVASMLKGFDDAHAAMSKELRVNLSKGEQERHQAAAEELRQRRSAEEERRRTTAQEIAQRKAGVATMLQEFAKGDAERKSDVSTMLNGFREEQAGVRGEWQKLTATMQSKRGGVAVAVKPPIEEIAEGAAEITPETVALSGQVFEYLANHPDGTRLVGLAEEFGIARIQMAKVIRKLQDENKVEKRDLLYFAV